MKILNKLYRKITSVFEKNLRRIKYYEMKMLLLLVDKKVIKLKRLSKRDTNIVSITTIESRINFVHIPIITMLLQNKVPDKIILWLDNEKFSLNNIPPKLSNLIYYGLDIRFVEDIGVHTKYYYAISDFPNSNIITIDDDIIYERNTLKILMRYHKKYPNTVICNRAHKIGFDINNKILSYRAWKSNHFFKGPSHFLLQTGVGGVLYPPKCLHSDFKRLDLIKKLAPTNDDIWLKFMLILNSVKVLKTRKVFSTFKNIDGSQDIALNKLNVINNRNDLIIANIIDYYVMDLKKYIEEINI